MKQNVIKKTYSMQENKIIPKSTRNIMTCACNISRYILQVCPFKKLYIKLKVSNYFETVYILCIITENISVLSDKKEGKKCLILVIF